MVFDTGVLLELALGSPASAKIKERVANGEMFPLTGELNLAELRYVLCRKVGDERAARALGHLRRASQVKIVPPSEFLDRAAKLKCSRSLSLVDCVTISMGESLGLPVLFARHESELVRELKRSAFATHITFLEGD
jgi:predicted nucleic acid-binding protein